MHRHLVAVEVGIEGGAGQRMELDRLAVDQHGLEGLHAQPVQRGRAVEKHRMVVDHVGQDVADVRIAPFSTIRLADLIVLQCLRS